MLDLQRTVGNAATTALISPRVQRMRLTGPKKNQYRNKYEGWKGDTDDFDGFVEWCHSTTQADDIFASLNYDQWSTITLSMTGQEAYDHGTAKEAFQACASPQAAKTVDKYATVKAKIKAEHLSPERFTDDELDAIEAGKNEHGWSGAIQNIWKQKTDKEQSQQLAAQRRQRYQAAKAAGDNVFTAGLLRDVWLVAWSVATSGDASPNTTVAQERPDATILPTVNSWRAQQTTILGQGPGRVSNFHVPGGPAPIEDKSRRTVNPDPTRGRQADFISEWGGTTINVHVDALPQH